MSNITAKQYKLACRTNKTAQVSFRTLGQRFLSCYNKMTADLFFHKAGAAVRANELAFGKIAAEAYNLMALGALIFVIIKVFIVTVVTIITITAVVTIFVITVIAITAVVTIAVIVIEVLFQLH